MTKKYSCNVVRGSEIENMVNEQKLVTFEGKNINHFRIGDSNYLTLNYSKAEKSKDLAKTYDFTITNKYD